MSKVVHIMGINACGNEKLKQKLNSCGSRLVVCPNHMCVHVKSSKGGKPFFKVPEFNCSISVGNLVV
jgi:hypothetical protein